ncbi:MAG: substrate-binding domain-containing protein, partial [Lachnospiraceae bacterium]|nr:substrate-binding domain-containing protein [Lachnospiraceae bacterium]
MRIKKILAVVLAAAVVFALAACGSSGGGGETPEPAGSGSGSAPASDAEFTWNGQKEVWAILPTTAVPGLMVHADTMGFLMEKEGWTYATKDAQGQPSAQVDFVNDAIAAGNVGALMIAAMDVDMLEDVCAQAREAGIAVNMLGVAPQYPVAGFIATAYDLTGEYAVRAAQDWAAKRTAEGGNVPKNADGKYEVAVDYYTDIIDGIYRSNAVFGTIEESDDLVAVSATQSYGESTQTTAYENAQTALAAHPDCRIFVCYEPDPAMGIATAVAEYAAQNNLDLADFCVIPCYNVDDTFMAMYAEAEANHGANAIKGYASFGGSREGPDNDAFHAVEKY